MFVITGTGRGGTSIVTCMLQAHPKMDMLFENAEPCRTPKEPWQERERKDNEQGIIFGSKILEGSLFLKERYPERLKEWYKDTKFCFIFRSGLDMIAMNKPYIPGNIRENIIKWNRYIDTSLRFIDKNKERCMTLKYTDFIEEPKKHLRRICDFVMIEYDDCVFDFSMEYTPYFKKYGNRVDTSRVYLWEKLMATPSCKEGTELRYLLLKAEIELMENLIRTGYKN